MPSKSWSTVLLFAFNDAAAGGADGICIDDDNDVGGGDADDVDDATDVGTVFSIVEDIYLLSLCHCNN